MLLSFAFLFLGGLFLALLSERLNLPRIIGMLLAGVLLGPYLLDLFDASLLDNSAAFRRMALIIILIKAGLTIDLKDLKKVGRPALLMSFVPASFEILAYLLFAPILLGMSLATWMVILIKALDLMKYKKQARALQGFWHSEDFTAGLNQLGSDPTNPFRHLALEGREATAHHRNTKAHLHDALDVSDWVTRCLRNSIDEFTARLQSGLAILASVGSTAPFIGLFGTVWGIYHALVAIGSSGQSTIDKVAGPIGEALIMTALGLAVAIPAVLGYNALVRGNKFILGRLNSFAHELHAYFVTGARVSSARSGSSAQVLPLKKEA